MALRALWRRVEPIAEDGVTEGLKVHSQLVRAAGDGFKFKAGICVGAFPALCDDAVAGQGTTAAGVVNDLAWSVFPVIDQWQVNLAAAVR